MHYIVSVVLFACIFESFLTLLVYWLDNRYQGSNNGFWIFISFMEVVKSVFSRVIVLLTALGQNITKHKISEKHMTNIGIMSLLYGISLAIDIIIDHLQDLYHISTPVILIGKMPNHVMNILIFVWILLAFRQTIVTLQ